nr:hypothetical protein [Polymorphobacter sp.]
MIGVLMMATAMVSPAVDTLLPGTYTNEEQVYFAREAGTPVPPWSGLRITGAAPIFQLQRVDAFGTALGPAQPFGVRETPEQVAITTQSCTRDYARVPAGLTVINQTGACNEPAAATTFTGRGMAMTMSDGTVLEFQRARAFKCWASIPRKALKDGKLDWWFKAGLMLHDAGGRVVASTDEAVPQSFTLRMRNVAWPSGNNQPSLVLYVHADDPDHAIGYSWADPVAKRVGINLRTMQASCSLAG